MLSILTVTMIAAASAAQLQQPAAAASSKDPVTFTIRVENVSKSDALKLSSGEAAPAPTAPVLWVVHSGKDPLFTTGALDRGQGLEMLAEDGDPSALSAALEGKPGIVATGFTNTPKGDAGPGPITPGKAYEFRLSARAGEKLTLAFMFGQSNDLFYAPRGEGIALFDGAGRPLNGDITRYFILWDAGTEVNQEPGAGADQAPRQKGPNTGAAERKPIDVVKDRYTYPATGDVVRVTISVVK